MLGLVPEGAFVMAGIGLISFYLLLFLVELAAFGMIALGNVALTWIFLMGVNFFWVLGSSEWRRLWFRCPSH